MSRPEALRLADAIDPFVRPYAPDHLTSKVAAAELRRLSAVEAQRDALLEALLGVEKRCSHSGYVGNDGQFLKVIQAAIAKAEDTR